MITLYQANVGLGIPDAMQLMSMFFLLTQHIVGGISGGNTICVGSYWTVNVSVIVATSGIGESDGECEAMHV